MENKKLVNILLKDMGELQELIAEAKTKGSFDAIELEFMHTRAKGVMQLLKMLNGFHSNGSVQKEEPKIVQPVQEDIVEEVVIEEEVEEIVVQKEVDNSDIQQDSIEEVKSEPEIISEKVEPVVEVIKDETAELKTETLPEDIPVNNSKEEIIEQEKEISANNEVELEDEEKIEVNQRLGDSFLKGKSVNDLIEDQNNLESKLSNRPVSSIQSSIGINDRFQFIRELFEGNPEQFKEAVVSLDAMNNINEAVLYLQKNYKWKKNETSLKFVNLIKRRFAND